MRNATRTLCTIGAGLVWLAVSASAQSYHTYGEIGPYLQGIAADHPGIARYHDLGLSEEGRHLWAIQITDNPDLEEDEPEFRYISTMHGDEWVGTEMCLYLADYLTDNYGSDPTVTDTVDRIDIWIVPLMNPDGFVRTQRENANYVDLNRDFPDPYTSPSNTPAGRAAETAVIMNWSFASSFVASANFHTGALVVNYPYDNNPSGSSVYTASPDDDLFIYVSEQYSQHNSPMWNSAYFYHGITNGAAWYAISGGMQDWNYHYMGSNEVTIELSDTKIPSASQLPTLWNQNRDAMIAYMRTCLIGVRGVVTDAVTGQPLAATITVAGRDHEVYTDPDVGDYHRMLLPGTYDLHVEAAGYDPVTVTGVVVNSGDATRLDLALDPPPVVTYPNGGETLTAGTPIDVTWSGSATTSFQVQYTDNYGDMDTVADDFERASLGADYTTGGNRAWFITTGTYHSGSRSARAGDISNDEVSWMTRTVGGGEVSFWYRVSSESGYDFFDFYIDGSRQIHESGLGSWTYYQTTLSAGAHELKWEYVKDYSVSGGSDTVWIDALTVVADNTQWTDIIAQTAPGASSASWTPPAPGDAYKVRVRSAYGDGFGVWDESDGVFSVQEGSSLPGDIDGDCDVDLSDLSILLAAYGTCSGDAGFDADADLDGDECIALGDLSILLAHYGEVCP